MSYLTPYLTPSSSPILSTKRIGQAATICESQWQRCASFCWAYQLPSKLDPCDSPYNASIDSIHILDDYSLLNIFYLYRPDIFDGDEGYVDRIIGGRVWDRERWWYKLAQVCRRWRRVLLGSASYLNLCLVCTYGTPVADMLAHSPPLPLVLDYFRTDGDINTEDEEGVKLALEEHDRVRRIRLRVPAPKLQKLFVAINREYPALEYLIMQPTKADKTRAVMLPKALQAPRLRHAWLRGFALPMESQLLTNAASMVTLYLYVNHSDAFFQPKTLLRWISSMPHLETLVINLFFMVPNRDVERQLMHTPIIPLVTLPNLRFLVLQSGSAYAEAIVRQITTPRLEKLDIWFFKQLTYSLPCLQQFINKTANLRFDSAKFEFSRDLVYAGVYLREEIEIAQIKMIPLLLAVRSWHLDWQVSSVAQIFNSISQVLSTVENLTLEHKEHSRSSDDHNEVDRAEWHRLLRPFSKVKTLRVGDGLVKDVSRSLRPEDGEDPLELLPELQSLTYSGIGDTVAHPGGAFASFVDARENADHPVTLVRPNARPATPEIWDW